MSRCTKFLFRKGKANLFCSRAPDGHQGDCDFGPEANKNLHEIFNGSAKTFLDLVKEYETRCHCKGTQHGSWGPCDLCKQADELLRTWRAP